MAASFVSAAVFPDEELEGRTLVLALFDNDPASDLDRLQRLPAAERQQLAQVCKLPLCCWCA